MREIYNLKQLTRIRVIGLVEHPLYTYRSNKKRRWSWLDRPEGILYEDGLSSHFYTVEEFHELNEKGELPGYCNQGKLILCEDNVVCHPPKVQLTFNQSVGKTVSFETLEEANAYASELSSKMDLTIEFN